GPLSADWLCKHLTSIATAGSRILANLQDITDTARLQMGEQLDLRLETVDLGALVRDVAGSLEAGGPDGAAPVVVDAREAVRTTGDRRQLERVVQNIIGN